MSSYMQARFERGNCAMCGVSASRRCRCLWALSSSLWRASAAPRPVSRGRKLALNCERCPFATLRRSPTLRHYETLSLCACQYTLDIPCLEPVTVLAGRRVPVNLQWCPLTGLPPSWRSCTGCMCARAFLRDGTRCRNKVCGPGLWSVLSLAQARTGK